MDLQGVVAVSPSPLQQSGGGVMSFANQQERLVAVAGLVVGREANQVFELRKTQELLWCCA